MDNQNLNNFALVDEEESFDYKQLLNKVINHWYWFAISIVICLAISVFYIKYVAVPSFNITSKILVEDPKSGSGGMAANSPIDISSLFNLPSNAQNEIDILNSRSLMEKVVDQLNLNNTLYKLDGLKSVELFNNSPFEFKVIYKNGYLSSGLYNIELTNNDNIHLSNDVEALDIQAKFGQLIKLNQFDLVFTRKSNFKNLSGKYKLVIVSRDRKVEALSHALNVQLSDKQSTTIDLGFTYPVSSKGEVILQSLMNNYLQSNLQNKVQTADSTVAFISRRLVIVQKELSGVENDFADFKRENSIADVEAQSKALVSGASDYYTQLNTLEIQLSVINDLEKYISDPKNKTIIPSSLTDQDPVFAAGIGKYNDLLLERDKLNMSYTNDNPIVKSLDDQIANVKGNLIKSFEVYKKGLQVSKKGIEGKSDDFTARIKNVPKKEKVFLDYSRQQDLKQQLYLFLLQKKEEMMISKTSTISSARIIDNAKSDQEPFKPNVRAIYMVGFGLGLILPFAFLFIKDRLNIKIVSKQDIESNSKVPILAEIGNNESKDSLVVAKGSRSIISEQFRSLRTNLQFLIKQNQSQVIMFTSSMSGEGKTFISLNLGSTFALTGKKVIFLELDLRKPKLSANMGMDNSVGFANYIISDNNDYKKFIQPLFFDENCYLMSSGPVPPNPSELLLSDKLTYLMEQLKKDFDFIIIDSPPVGLVADSLILEKFADLTLYVVRQKYTFKAQLNIANDLAKEGRLRRVYLVVNDIETKQNGYYGYGYGYGTGYGYGYYSESVKSKSDK